MGNYALIDRYLDELERNFSQATAAGDVVDELRDHLYTAAEEAELTGGDAESAEKEVLSALDAPSHVAAIYAAHDQRLGEPSSPTSFTNHCGRAGVMAGVLWVGFAVLWFGVVYLETRLGRFEGLPQRVWLLSGFCLLAAGTLTFIALLGVYRRYGGFGVLGKAGIAIIGLSIFASLVGFAVTRRLRFVSWGSVLAVGALLVAIAMWRRHLAPRWAHVSFGVGMATGIVTWFILDLFHVDAPDHVDGHVHSGIINSATLGLAVGTLLTAAGIAGIGYWLLRERPVAFTPISES